jgi:sugar phosphate isomerase/epimerase
MDIVNDIENIIREHEILGCKYIGIGGSGEKYRYPGWVSRFADDYHQPAQMMKDAGFRFMYHTHSDEWGRLPDGRLILDGLLDGMPKELMGITLDLYWLQYAGVNVQQWIEKLQNRLQCVHFKDMGIVGNQQVMTPVGEGNMDYPGIYALLKKLGKTEYALVEQDDCYKRDPFDCLASSYRYLKQLENDK